MKNMMLGIVLGAIAGIIDVIPMILQRFSWDANISAFLMWVIIGFLLSITRLKTAGAVKGILISFLVLTPSAVIIGWQEPVSLIPISFMTLILGSLLGIVADKVVRE